MAGLYIHIPFCKQACYYCDFHFSTNQSQRRELIELIAREIALQRQYLNANPLDTIYWGGGTPSMLTAFELDLLVDAIHKNFSIVMHPEVTLEANPDDLSPEKLALLKTVGINRLSIGIQSFDDNILKFLNRAHRTSEAIQCIHQARKAGFDNISIDLIYSIPGQDDALLNKNLATALALNPEHISAYSLTVEEKTVFGRWASQGKLTAMAEDVSAQQFLLVMDTLGLHGYDHYEISNYCRPGFESKHNTSYWQQKPYLGVGPSAHSFDSVSRQCNVSNNYHYASALRENRLPFDREVLTPANKINEYIFTSLRTRPGCNLQHLKTTLKYDLIDQNRAYIEMLVESKHMELKDNSLVLTRSGKLLADQISSDLFVILEK
ncbi:MAG: radical SAM family heme chaperone HemW [Cyclobacteriaceae bacterium]|nr:radical SAM family heme chaperone HemW [Cyclobacteriaceae bacterium]